MLTLILKRILCSLAVGATLVASAFLAIILAIQLKNFDLLSVESSLVLGLVVGVMPVVYVSGKTSRFTIKYDAARFLADRRAAAKHPRRTKVLRLARRFLFWLPSAWAFFVLFFFPQVSHLFHTRAHQTDERPGLSVFLPKLNELLHPGADYVTGGSVQIPWGWTILQSYDSPGRFAAVNVFSNRKAPWPFGRMSIWNPKKQLRLMTFGIVSAEELAERRTYSGRLASPNDPQSFVREIRANGLTLSCRETQLHVWWKADCDTVFPTQRINFEARYLGSPDGLPDFYRLLATAKPPYQR